MEYASPILVVSAVTIVGKLIFSSLGMILSGQNLHNAMLSGFSLAQIGEFAFIIASLGMDLGVTGEFLYPIVVSVSVITTFTTPFCIKIAPKTVGIFEEALPDKLAAKLNQYTAEDQAEKEKDKDWYMYIKAYFSRMAIFGGIMAVIVILGIKLVEPFLALRIEAYAASIITCVFIYVGMGLFISPMLDLHSNLFTSLWLKNKSFRLPLMVLANLKTSLIAVIAMIPLAELFGIRPLWLFFVTIIIVYMIAKYGSTASWYLHLETRFLRNFNERLLEKEEETTGKQTWLYDDLHIVSCIAPEGAVFLDTPLKDLELGKKYNVYVVKIERKNKPIFLPEGNESIHAGDKIYVTGEERAILNFYKLIDSEPCKRMRTLRQFMETDYPYTDRALAICAVKVTGKESFAGKPIKLGNIRDDWKCMILGVQRDGLPIVMPNASMVIAKDDLMWVMGSNTNAGLLMAMYTDEQ